MLETPDFKSSRPILLILAAAVLAVLPAILYGVPASRDLYHHLRLAILFFDAAAKGDFYPGWLAEANGTFGEVSPRFYPPGLSYLLVAARVLLGGWYAAALAVFVILTFAGGAGAYFWARSFVPREIAMWAGVLYIFTPYHLNELYQSSLLAEYAGACVLPFVFAFTERICRGGRKRDIAGLGASYACLILTNTPLTVIGSYALLVYALLSMDRKSMRETAPRLALGAGLGMLASAGFWVTVISELRWLRPDIEPENVFSSRLFLFSTFQRTRESIWYGNLIALATLTMALPALILLRTRLLKTVGSLMIGSLLMSTLISYPLWQVLPQLKAVQVPWRWLAVTSMCAAVLASASIVRWKEAAKGRGRPLAMVAVGCVVGSVAFSISHPVREAPYASRVQLEQVLQNLGLPSIGAWYPLWVAEKFLYTPQEVVAEERAVTVSAWEPERRTFHVGAGKATDARVRTFYYPLWKASVEGKPLPIRPAQDGAILISLPAEAVTIDLVFLEPWRSTVSVVLSAIGWFLIAALSLLSREAAVES
jgi:hypothetical protein